MDCCSSNYNADFSKHPHHHHPHNYGVGGGGAASHPYYSQIYNQTSMRYPHTHAAHRDETLATGYGAGNSQQSFYDVGGGSGGGGGGGSSSGGSSYERYNNSSYLNHQNNSGTYPNTFNNNYGALRDSYGNGNNETNSHYYYHHQNQSTHHQPTTANGFYSSHSYDSYRNVSGNYPYHPHYNNNNTTAATTTPPSTGYHHAQQQSLPSHFYPYNINNNNNISSSNSEHYINASSITSSSSRYYPTPPPSAPPPPSQRDLYAMRDPHQSNSDDSTYSPSCSDKHNNDNMSLDNFNQNVMNSDSATTTPSLVSPTLSATQKSQQLSPNEDTDEITRSKSPPLLTNETTVKSTHHQQTTCELSKMNGDSEGRKKNSGSSDCGEEDKQHLHQQISKHEQHNQQQNTLDFDSNHNHHNCNTNNNQNTTNNNNTNTNSSPQDIPAIVAAVDSEEQQHSPATAFPFNHHHHTTKDFSNTHNRSRKSQREKDKYFKTISSSRKTFDGQPLSSINDPYERCSTPFVSMSPYNQNHMPHNYQPHQRLPPSFPPHGAGHGYWYSQPPHHPHHPWMMNPYARNRRGSFIDAQILPSSVHYGRSPSLHMDKHKIHGIHDETPPPKRTRKRTKPASPAKAEVREDLMKNVTPLPGFLQTFGGTEIGRFSEAFFTTAESPNPYYNNSIESDVESPQPWDYDSLEGPINLQVGAAFQLYGGSENEFESPINNFSKLICNEY